MIVTEREQEMTTETTETNSPGGGSKIAGRRSRTIMAAGLALGLVTGTGVSLAAGWPFAAGASSRGNGVEASGRSNAHDAPRDTEAPDEEVDVHDDVADPASMLLEILQPLVDDGTLTQEQMDAVIEALSEAHDDMDAGPMGDADGHGSPGMRGMGHGRAGGALLAEAAKFLGLDMRELMAELKSGKTLAEIAEAHGKSRQELVDALVAGGIKVATERLNDQVSRFVDGEIGPRQNS